MPDKPPIASETIKTVENDIHNISKKIGECSDILKRRLNDPDFQEAVKATIKKGVSHLAMSALQKGGDTIRERFPDSEDIENNKGRMEKGFEESERKAQGEEMAYITKNCRTLTQTGNSSERHKLIKDSLRRIGSLEKAGVDITSSYMMMPNDPQLFQKLWIDTGAPDFKKNTMWLKDGSIGISYSFLRDSLKHIEISGMEDKKDVQSENMDVIGEKVLNEGRRLKADIDKIKKQATILSIWPSVDAGSTKVEEYLQRNYRSLSALGDNVSSINPEMKEEISNQMKELLDGIRTASTHSLVPQESKNKAKKLLPYIEGIQTKFA